MNGTGDGWTSAGVVSGGPYGVPRGLASSFPVQSVDGGWQIVEDLENGKHARLRIDASVAEPDAERDVVRDAMRDSMRDAMRDAVRSLGLLPA